MTAYPPKVFPESVTIVGSGVTGVEFVHMFSSFGAGVTLVVSRQQVLPGKDPEVAAVLEDEFMRRGVKLLIGARAQSIERTEDGDGVVVRCDDGRVVESTHAVLAIGSVPNTESLGLESAGIEVDEGGYLPINHHCVTNVRHIYAAGDVSGKLPLSSVASIQGRKVAEHVMGLHTVEHRHLDYDKAASAIFTEPEIADVGLAEAEAFSVGPQDQGDEGAVLRRPPRRSSTTTHARLREDHLRSQRPVWCSAVRSWAVTRPN